MTDVRISASTGFAEAASGGLQRLVELLQAVFDAQFRQFALVAEAGVQVVAGDAEFVGDLVQV